MKNVLELFTTFDTVLDSSLQTLVQQGVLEPIHHQYLGETVEELRDKLFNVIGHLEHTSNPSSLSV
jgi:hypothetical protein